MDQLASVGCEFLDDSLDKIHRRNIEYYKKSQTVKQKGLAARCLHHLLPGPQRKEMPWAVKPIFDENKPIRPWSLHSTVAYDNIFYNTLGRKVREPGRYKRFSPENSRQTDHFLVNTNERVHPSVRVRLACGGLGPNDSGAWHCPPLLKKWRPRLVNTDVYDPIPNQAAWGPSDVRDTDQPGNTVATAIWPQEGNGATADTNIDIESTDTAGPQRWVWEYTGDDANAPNVTTMIEENMGPFEKHLLNLSRGKVSVDEYAKKRATFGTQAG